LTVPSQTIDTRMYYNPHNIQYTSIVKQDCSPIASHAAE